MRAGRVLDNRSAVGEVDVGLRNARQLRHDAPVSSYAAPTSAATVDGEIQFLRATGQCSEERISLICQVKTHASGRKLLKRNELALNKGVQVGEIQVGWIRPVPSQRQGGALVGPGAFG